MWLLLSNSDSKEKSRTMGSSEYLVAYVPSGYHSFVLRGGGGGRKRGWHSKRKALLTHLTPGSSGSWQHLLCVLGEQAGRSCVPAASGTAPLPVALMKVSAGPRCFCKALLSVSGIVKIDCLSFLLCLVRRRHSC